MGEKSKNISWRQQNFSSNIILYVRLSKSRKACSSDCPVICDERLKIPKAEDESAVLFGCV